MGRPGAVARFSSASRAGCDAGADGSPRSRGYRLARTVRRDIGLQGPVSDAAFHELLGMRPADAEAGSTIALGTRDDDGQGAVLRFRRSHRSGHRFEAARFFADHLITAPDDRWLVQTDAATARQQAQRSFAAEFLAPMEELRAELGADPTDEALEEAGARYGVSDRLVEHQLANHADLRNRQAA